MPFCSNCGKELFADAKFCSGCGKENKEYNPSVDRDGKYDITISPAIRLYGPKDTKTEVSISVPQLNKKMRVLFPNYFELGQTLRLRGEGLVKPDGDKGDLLITPSEVEHYDIELTISARLVGAKDSSTKMPVYLPHAEKTVQISIPNNITVEKTLRLKGLGLESPNGETGDLYLRFNHIEHEKNDTNITTNEAKDIRSQRKIVYDGEIHKCPNCGEVLKSFSSVCPACGIELRGAKSSDSVTQFTSKLETAQTEDERINIIRNFPISNTKEDIWEIMVLASTNILGNQSLALRRAWNAKFEQGYQKAQLVFAGDDLMRITALYEDTKKKIRSDDIVQGTKATGKVIGAILSGIFSGIGYILKKLPIILVFLMRNILAILCVVAYLKSIQIDRTGENGVGYQLLGALLSCAASFLLFRKNASYLDILIVGACGGIHFYLAQFLENGAGLQLFGVVTLFLVLIAFIRRVNGSGSKEGNE